MIDVSIIIPTLNEEGVLHKTLGSLLTMQGKGVEIIVADGGSADATIQIAEQFNVRVIQANAGRANQLNKGAEAASGDVLLFLHADTLLPSDAYELLLEHRSNSAYWGRFDVTLDSQKWMFRMIEAMMNWRSRLTSIVTGDQAMFVSKGLFERVGGFPGISLMEDIAISKILKNISAPICFKQRVTTSSRRWLEQGVLKTVFLMWRLRWAYFFNVDPDALAKKYYRHNV
ncbi:MAG: TIGR04283 family arsenosugar biosynthesis glycosyltransferase [Cycloclasticus sp.]